MKTIVNFPIFIFLAGRIRPCIAFDQKPKSANLKTDFGFGAAMSDLDELYRELILDHNKNPRNFRVPAGANHKAEGYNPLCGDRFAIYIKLEDGAVKDVGFQGSGCAISKASASLLTERVKGKNVSSVLELFEIIHTLLTSNTPDTVDRRLIGKLSSLEGVRKFPTRVKCATLAWHTLKAALEEKENIVITE